MNIPSFCLVLGFNSVAGHQYSFRVRVSPLTRTSFNFFSTNKSQNQLLKLGSSSISAINRYYILSFEEITLDINRLLLEDDTAVQVLHFWIPMFYPLDTDVLPLRYNILLFKLSNSDDN
ncbi:hypothetical protein V2J09_022028 [Rumex salicifolius]